MHTLLLNRKIPIALRRRTDRAVDFARISCVAAVGLSMMSLAFTAISAETPPAAEDNQTFWFAALVGIGLIVATALIVTGLALWSRKQDQQSQMMSFCIRHLIHSDDENESREAAETLGHARNPAAMLVLIEVVGDDETEESVRMAAHQALGKMRGNYRKYKEFIDQALTAIEKTDHQRLIDLLTRSFERSEDQYAQSAYLIGREYMRLGHYEDAREWLQTADFRNRKLPLYGNQIRRLAEKCIEYLFAEGDTLYKVGRYQDARERFAAASHGLNEEWRRHYAAYLRMACVYCKLRHYNDADQATLRALHEDEATDDALRLSKLIQRRAESSSGDQRTDSPDELTDTEREIDVCVDEIMDTLLNKQYGVIKT